VHNLCLRRYGLGALLVIKVGLDSKFRPSFLETVDLLAPAQHIGDFSVFSVSS
jgi:hypothetical protein